MTIDTFLYQLPIIGKSIQRLYSYFKTQTALTDLFHVLVGLGLGLLIAGGGWVVWGALALGAGIMFHVYAFLKAPASS